MKTLAIIIPACIQNRELLDQFQRNLHTFSHDAIGRIIVICNRLSLMSSSALEELLQRNTCAPVQVVHEKERSVAGAWNRGIEIAREANFNLYMITAVDVAITSRVMNELIAFGDKSSECDIWSATSTRTKTDPKEKHQDGCDFSCFMLRDDTIWRHGWFDKEYKPAYFENNDYVTRVVLGGGRPTQVLAARHEHAETLTIRLDSEMAHHVRHWFGINSARFHQKWGIKTNDYVQLRKECHSSPFKSGKPLHWWPEQDRIGYSPSAGIHE